MNKFLTFQDIKASLKKYNDKESLFTIFGKPKLYTTKGNVLYAKVRWKDVNGNWAVPNLKFTNQILAAGIKFPWGYVNDGRSLPKNMIIGISKMKREQIEGGDYVIKKLPSDATEEEKKRAQDNYKKGIDKLMCDNSDFTECLGNIADAFIKWIEKEKNVIADKQGGTEWIRDCKPLKLYQSEAKDEQKKNMIKLENNFFRLYLNVYISPDDKKRECGKYSGRIGYYDTNKRKFIYSVRNSEGKSLTVKGKPVILKYNNIENYVTYKSRCSGYLSFENVIFSSRGISLKFNIKELNVRRHSPIYKQSAQTEEDIEASKELDDCFDKVNSDDDFDDENKKVEQAILNTQNDDIIANAFDKLDTEPEEQEGDDSGNNEEEEEEDEEDEEEEEEEEDVDKSDKEDESEVEEEKPRNIRTRKINKKNIDNSTPKSKKIKNPKKIVKIKKNKTKTK